ncbi:MAG: NADPH-dependent FMN reductase [Bacteroidia bacterium]
MITIIAGTNRKGSYTKRVAEIYKGTLSKQNIDCQILSLEELPKDFIFSEFEKQSDNYIAFLKPYIIDVDRFIFIIPEYNGSFPGILKAFIDTVPPKYFRGKTSCLVGISSGHMGSVRSLDDFTDILHYLGVEVLSNKPKFSNIERLLNENNQFIDEANQVRILKQLEIFARF